MNMDNPKRMAKVKIGSNGSIVGRAMVQPDFHRAYISASRRLLSDFNSDRHWNNEDALPIFFLQRHALELLIKDSLRIVYRVMLAEHNSNNCLSEPSKGQLTRLTREHDLLKLYDDLDGSLFLERDGCSVQIERLKKLLDEVVAIEEHHTWARYPEFCKEDRCVIQYMMERSFDPEWIQREIEEVSSLLVGTDENYRDALMYRYDSMWQSLMRKMNDRND